MSVSPFQWLRALARRLDFHLNRDRYARELSEEMALHLELKQRDLELSGVPAGETAAAAHRQFGDTARLAESSAEVMSMGWLEQSVQDARYALRSMRAHPTFTLAAVSSLALGIGAATAVFVLVNAMLLAPLPFPNAERLVVPYRALTPGIVTAADTVPWSHARYEALRSAVPAFEEAGFATWDEVNVRTTPGGGTERIVMEFMTPSLFQALGVGPARGRGFQQQDADEAPVALVSDGFWRRALAGDSTALGREIIVNGTPVTVIGVLPASFAGFHEGAQLWIPLEALPMLIAGRGGQPPRVDRRMGVMVARVRQDVSIAAANEQVGAALARIDEESPEPFTRPGSVWSAGVLPLAEARRHPLVEPLLGIFSLVVGGVLLIVCANVAGLMLARARARRGEIGVRIALGGGRSRLVRQFLTESMLLATVGAVPGVILGQLAAVAIAKHRPDLPASFVLLRSTDLLEGVSLAPDWRIAAFAVALTLIVAMLFGAAPALAVSRQSASGLLKVADATRGSVSAPGRKLLAVVQVALAVCLLTGAAVMLRSSAALLRTDLGFEPEGLAMVRIAPSEAGLGVAARQAEWLARIAALPGVHGVATHNCLPFAGDCMLGPITGVDDRAAEEGTYPPIEHHLLSPDYLRVMGTPLLAGRTLDAAGDSSAEAPAVLVNETAARLLWPDISPIGRTVRISPDPEAPPFEVVGVVADARFDGLDQPVRPAIYRSGGDGGSVLLVRTAGDPASLIPLVRREIAAQDPGVALHDATTGVAVVRDAASSVVFVAGFLTTFAILAMVLAAIGLYGVLAYQVTQRSREFGIRMAIGASRARVMAMVMRQGAAVVLAGVLAGSAVAWWGTPFLSRFLHGIGPRDAGTYALTFFLVAAVGLVAAFIPARRATRVEPVLALRE